MREMVTQLILKSGEKLYVPLETGLNIRQAINRDPNGHIMLSTHNNRMIQKYQIVDIDDVAKSTRNSKAWGTPVNDPKFLLPGYEKRRATPDSEGYKKFQALKKRLLGDRAN